jgi:hypothetical protein
LLQARGVRGAIIAVAGRWAFSPTSGIGSSRRHKARVMAERLVHRVISYGEWTRPRMRNFREQCCDCGLIHRLDFRIVDGRVEFRTRRDDRATAARRSFKFIPDE